jgi:hypothetical protein
MKTLRQTCAVAVLTVLLSVCAFAGQINCPGVVSVPPPPNETSTSIESDITTTLLFTVISVIPIP